MARINRRLRRTGARTLGILLALVGLMALTAVPASAHHAELTASASCPGTVNWTATAWAGSTTASRTNSDVIVYKKIGSAARVQVGTGSFNSGNSFTFSGSFTVDAPLPASVQVIVRANANWGNNSAGGQETTVTVTMPTNCTPPVVIAPKATITASCSTVAVALNNSGSNQAVTYTVTTPQGTTESHTVAAGATKNLSYAAKDGATVEVKNGATSLAKTVLDCPALAPAATITPGCTSVAVVLDNSGSNRAVEFSVTTPAGAVQKVTVAAGATKNLSYAAIDGATVEVKNGATSLAKSVLDCPVLAPVASITPDCAGVSVLLDNSGSNRPTTYAVTKANGNTVDYTVAAHGTKTVTFAAIDGATVEVKVDGVSLATSVLDCPVVAPVSTITPGCTVVSVLLDNSGSNRPVDFTVTNPAVVAQVVTVAGGAQQTVTYPAVDGATVTVKVGNQVLDSANLDCPVVAPVSTITPNCTSVGIVLDNSGSNRPAAFTVTTPAGASDVVTVAAAAQQTVYYSAVDGATVTVKVGNQVLDSTTLDCPVVAPVVTITPGCTDVSVELDNSGSNRPATYAVTTPAGAVQNVTVAAGAKENLSYAAIDGATVEVAVDGTSLAKVVLDCPVVTPVASITPDCAQVTILLDNSGSNRPATYTVTTPAGANETHTVEAGKSTTLTYPALDGGTFEVKLGDTSLAKVVLDCPVYAPVSTITPGCTTVSVLLDNSGSNRPIDFAVTTPAGTVETVPVLAGQTVTVDYPAVPSTTTSVTATGMDAPATGATGVCGTDNPGDVGSTGDPSTDPGDPSTDPVDPSDEVVLPDDPDQEAQGGGTGAEPIYTVTGLRIHETGGITGSLPGTGGHLPIGLVVIGSVLVGAGALTTRKAALR